MTTLERRQLKQGLLFVSPWFVGLGVFLLYPILASLYFSFCEYSVLQHPVWIGAGNYADLVQDSVFWKSLANTLLYAAFALPMGVLVSLSLAILLNTGVRGLAVFRTIMFLPALVPMVALAIVWLWIFNGQYGLLNNLLSRGQMYWVLYLGYALPIAGLAGLWLYDRLSLAWGAARAGLAGLVSVAVGIVIVRLLHPEAGVFAFALAEKFRALHQGPPGWLADPGWSKPALVIMSLWGGGNAMVIYLAGLQDVPVHLYDAAELDGANWVQKIRHVALPAISPVILFNLIMGIIGSLQFFAVPYVIAPNGAPDRSIYFLTMYLYDNAFTYLRMGYASAMAWILFIIIFVLTLVALRLSRRFVYYEEGKVTARSPLAKVLVYLVLVALSALFLMPLAWTVSTSLKPGAKTMELPPRWWPKPIVWKNYVDAVTYRSKELGYIPMLRQAENTLYLAVLSLAGTVVSNALIAYGFARLRWRGRDVLFAITLATMMVPFPVTMVAVFSVFKSLGWIGSFRPLWVPAWFGSAFNIFLLRQFFLTIPRDLSDAASIDGCSELQTFWHIILPLSRPALAVVGLFHFMYVWNDFLGPLIYLTDERMFTLSLGLQAYQSQHGGTEWHMLMAASMIVITPLIALFFLTQKTFIQGITLTGIKG